MRPLLVSAKAILHRDFPGRRSYTRKKRERAMRQTKHLLGSKLEEYETGQLGSVHSRQTTEHMQTPIIWVLWLQGFDLAPPVAKFCLQRLQTHSPMPIRALDLEQTLELIDIPQRIMQLYKDGLVTNVSLSDLIRVKLLNVYGGMWLDSTVLVRDFEHLASIAGSLDDKLWWAGCQLPEKSGKPINSVSTWAMAGAPGAHWSKHVIDCFEELLIQTTGGLHYFDLPHIFVLLFEACPRCRDSILEDEAPDSKIYDRLHDAILKGKKRAARRIWHEAFLHKLNHKTFVFQEKHRTFLSQL